MSKTEWQAKLADFVPLYEAGAYTANEFFWFTLPLFDGGEDDKALWDALPKEVQDRFLAQMAKSAAESAVASDPAAAALVDQLLVVRRALSQ